MAPVFDTMDDKGRKHSKPNNGAQIRWRMTPDELVRRLQLAAEKRTGYEVEIHADTVSIWPPSAIRNFQAVALFRVTGDGDSSRVEFLRTRLSPGSKAILWLMIVGCTIIVAPDLLGGEMEQSLPVLGFVVVFGIIVFALAMTAKASAQDDATRFLKDVVSDR